MKFRLFSVPVHIQPIFWVVAVVLGAPSGTSSRELAELAIWVVVLLVSILVHELGHAFAMRAYGNTPSIELWGLGGLTHWGPGAVITPGRDIAVSLAGPFAGLLLGAGVFALSRISGPETGSLLEFTTRQALWINVAWGIVNLLPILPLDGGRVLESLASALAGRRGRRVAHGISLLLAASAAGIAFYTRQVWLGILGLWCASISWQHWSQPAESPVAAATAAPPDAGNAATPAWLGDGADEVWRLLLSGRAQDAIERATELGARIPEGATHDAARTMALEVLAWAQIEAQDEAGALSVARRMPHPPSELLRSRLLVAEGKLSEGLAEIERLVHAGRESFPVLVLASVYLSEARPDFVVRLLLSPRGAQLSPETHVVLTAQLFHSGSFEACLEACRLGFSRFHTGVFAYNAACACNRLDRVDDGILWLERAVTAGFDDAVQLDTDEDIAGLRSDARFGEIRARVGASTK